MRIDLHLHTEDLDIFRSEKRNMDGSINIPESNAKITQYSLTHDKSYMRTTEYILSCWLILDSPDVENVVQWIYDKIKDKVQKITIGDLRGKSDYCTINKEEIKKILVKNLN